MNRREFMVIAGGCSIAAACPSAGLSQQGSVPLKVAILIGGPDDVVGQKRIATFRNRLEKLGWVEGQNLRLDIRWGAGDVNQIRTFAVELVASGPSVLLGTSTPVVDILQRQTSRIPIVFLSVSDPVGSGFVNSFGQPGGNITGFASFEYCMAGKWLGLLKEIVPSLAQVGILFNPKTTPGGGAFFTRPVHAVGQSLSVRTADAPIHAAAEIDAIIDGLTKKGRGGLIVIPEAFTVSHSNEIVAAANRFGLPAIYPWPVFVSQGGLMSYGIDIDDQFAAAADYVDRIHKGETPANLPVQAPTKFELVINLRTARALGLSVPPTLLARADEVIE